MRSLLGGDPTTLRVVDIATVAVVVGWLIGASGLVSLGAYRWKSGELTRTYRATYEDARNAAYDALQSLEMSLEDQKRNALMEMPYDAVQSVSSQKGDARREIIMAKRADGVDFRVEIKYLTDKTTQVGVRAGLLQTNLVGDRAASLRIHEAIQTKLKSSQPLAQLVEYAEE
ncbi:DUF3568 domain-containing protein [Nitrospinae bacterium AH_259_B05_G02_I21]|nr:DUF3568 domain-containing protein [Nitrospinae bacterium AH_259_B05_G02_I21]MDA2932191.1 DUF3568 domain-containing protein [Nitrospinae bacterium AH-259-F20]